MLPLPHPVESPDELRAENARLRAQLAALRQRKHAALDASPDGFALFRAEFDGDRVSALRLSFINAAGAAGFAGDHSTLAGRELRDFYPECLENGIWRDFVDVLTTGQQLTRLVDGTGPSWPGPQHCVIKRLDDDTLIATWRDISDQLLTQRELAAALAAAAEASATLQAALDASDDGFIIYERVSAAAPHPEPEPVLRVVTCNAAATRPRGLSPEQLVGKDPREYSDFFEASGLYRDVLATLADGRARLRQTSLPAGLRGAGHILEHSLTRVGEHRVVLTFRDITRHVRARVEVEQAFAAAEHAANHDPLTALPNRALLQARLAEALHECLPGHHVAVVFCDLNDFKVVNDTYGHAAGDAVLRATADRLAEIIRPGDTAARFAGDEFVVVLRDLPAGWLLESFVGRTAEHLGQPVALDGDTWLSPSAALGCYLAAPQSNPHDADAATVLAQADRAMYRVKQRRRQASPPRPAPRR